MINLDNIFSNDAFNNIEKDKLNSFKNFIKQIDGKPLNDIIPDIVNFFNNTKNDRQLSEMERLAIIKCFLENLDKEEQKKFISMFEMLENFN